MLQLISYYNEYKLVMIIKFSLQPSPFIIDVIARARQRRSETRI